LLRRYLKLAVSEAETRQLIGARLEEKLPVTFSVEHIPINYSQPGEFGNTRT